MDEAPKKSIRQWLPIGMIVVSLVFLYSFTYAQARRQYGRMADKIWLQASSLNAQGEGLRKPENMPLPVYLKDDIRWFLPVGGFINDYPKPNEYHAVIMLCRDDGIEQPISVLATRASPQLEETVHEMIREHAKLDCQPLCVNYNYRFGSGLPSPDFLTSEKFAEKFDSVFRLERYMNFCIDAGEEGRLYIAWAVEGYPFAAAMLQLIPVYLLTALLLTALALAKKKALSRGNQCPTPPNPT